MSLDLTEFQRPLRPWCPFRYAITGQIPPPMISGFGICAFTLRQER
jgi:hypothetical protein